MKVYIVHGNVDYEPGYVLAVCSTREKAEELKRNPLPEWPYVDSIHVAEWELDTVYGT